MVSDVILFFFIFSSIRFCTRYCLHLEIKMKCRYIYRYISVKTCLRKRRFYRDILLFRRRFGKKEKYTFKCFYSGLLQEHFSKFWDLQIMLGKNRNEGSACAFLIACIFLETLMYYSHFQPNFEKVQKGVT